MVHRRMRVAVVLVTCASLAGPFVHAQAAADLLSTGVVVSGAVGFEKSKQENAEVYRFLVNFGTRNSGPSVVIQLFPKYVTDKNSASSELYSLLAPGGFVTVRLAGEAPLEPGTLLNSALTRGVVWCFAELSKRDDMEAIYLLRCVNPNLERRVKADSGDIALEVNMLVSAPNQSAVDQFIVQRVVAERVADRFLYVRVEK